MESGQHPERTCGALTTGAVAGSSITTLHNSALCIVTTKSNRPDGVLDRVVVDRETAVVEVAT
jgi:hypothetical protein